MVVGQRVASTGLTREEVRPLLDLDLAQGFKVVGLLLLLGRGAPAFLHPDLIGALPYLVLVRLAREPPPAPDQPHHRPVSGRSLQCDKPDPPAEATQPNRSGAGKTLASRFRIGYALDGPRPLGVAHAVSIACADCGDKRSNGSSSEWRNSAVCRRTPAALALRSEEIGFHHDEVAVVERAQELRQATTGRSGRVVGEVHRGSSITMPVQQR